MYRASLQIFRHLLPYVLAITVVSFVLDILMQSKTGGGLGAFTLNILYLLAWSAFLFEALVHILQPGRSGVFRYACLLIGFFLRACWLSFIVMLPATVVIVFIVALTGRGLENPVPPSTTMLLLTTVVFNISFALVFSRWGGMLSRYVARTAKIELQSGERTAVLFRQTFMRFLKGPVLLSVVTLIPVFWMNDIIPGTLFNQYREPNIIRICLQIAGSLSFALSAIMTAWILSQSHSQQFRKGENTGQEAMSSA